MQRRRMRKHLNSKFKRHGLEPNVWVMAAIALLEFEWLSRLRRVKVWLEYGNSEDVALKMLRVRLHQIVSWMILKKIKLVENLFVTQSDKNFLLSLNFYSQDTWLDANTWPVRLNKDTFTLWRKFIRDTKVKTLSFKVWITEVSDTEVSDT